MMHAWTGEMGYPLLTVLPPSEGKKGLKLRQNRFLSKGPPTPDEDKVLWWIPITASSGSASGDVKPLETFVLSEREGDAESFDLPEGEGSWLRLNAGQTGIFRVNYTPELWKGLSSAVGSLQLPVIDRLGESDQGDRGLNGLGGLMRQRVGVTTGSRQERLTSTQSFRSLALMRVGPQLGWRVAVTRRPG